MDQLRSKSQHQYFNHLLGGWPSVFYIFGVIGLFWVIAWSILIADTPPQQYETLAPHEETTTQRHKVLASHDDSKQFDASLLDQANVNKPPLSPSPLEKDEEINLNPPWSRIFLSPAVWAVSIGSFCHDWIWFFVITDLPLYYKNVFDISVMESGLFSTLPIITATIMNATAGCISDGLQHRMKWSLTKTRRFMIMFGFFSSAALLLALSYTKEHEVVKAVVLTTLCAGVLRLVQPTLLSNIIDLSPTFTGVIFALVNTIAVNAGIGAPEMTGFATDHNPSSATYWGVFLVNAGICVAGGVASVFVNGDVQAWDPAYHDN